VPVLAELEDSEAGGTVEEREREVAQAEGVLDEVEDGADEEGRGGAAAK
jgi:hypothetical protein